MVETRGHTWRISLKKLYGYVSKNEVTRTTSEPLTNHRWEVILFIGSKKKFLICSLRSENIVTGNLLVLSKRIGTG